MYLIVKGFIPYLTPGSAHCQPQDPVAKTCFMCGVVASPMNESDKSDESSRGDVTIEIFEEHARRRCCGCICQMFSPAANFVSGDESTTA